MIKNIYTEIKQLLPEFKCGSEDFLDRYGMALNLVDEM